MNQTWRVALASLGRADSVAHGVEKIGDVLSRCAREEVAIACFPETYLPGLRGAGDVLPDPDQQSMENALCELRRLCRTHAVAAIVGMEWLSSLGLENRAVVIAATGRMLGYQAKNQLTPGCESECYVPGTTRRMFQVDGVKFGIVICHEAWRYPETVRWAAVRGARIVFQPQHTGSDRPMTVFPEDTSALHATDEPTSVRGKQRNDNMRWGESFYEKAMVCRAQENSIYFASVNRALKHPNSATSLIAPNGRLADFVPYGKEDLLIADIDLTKATGLYAHRLRPELLPE